MRYQHLLQEVEEEEPTGFVCFEKFQPMMAKVLLERRYQPVSEEMLLKAFQVLDVDKNSHITPEEMKTYMMEEGEVFQQVLLFIVLADCIHNIPYLGRDG